MDELIRSAPETADVIVLGAGLAGHCAAIAAAKAGARVLLVEKQDHVGGSTVLSGGFFALADTPLQRARGVRDSVERLLWDLREVGGGAADERLLQAYAEGQTGLFRWLVENGAEFAALELSAGQSVARSHRTDPLALIRRLSARLDQLGIARMMKTRATRLMRSSRTGTMTGVVVETGGTRTTRLGAPSVIIATGGFVWSDELLENFAPKQRDAVRVGGAGNTGDGLRMAWQLGAGFRDMGQIKGTFGTHPETRPDRHEILLAYYMGAIIVNRAGQRFVDESLSYKLLGDACLQQPEAIAWQVLDQAIFDSAPKGVPLFDLGPALERGLLIRADSLPELACRCGIEPDRLADTAARYNADVRAGRDTVFGRDGLCNHTGVPVPVETAPFYAYPSTSVVLATYCGLTIDPDTRVLDIMGEPIGGLYAAGEVTGGFHGSAYMTGTSLGKAAFFGRRAGEHAARHAVQQS